MKKNYSVVVAFVSYREFLVEAEDEDDAVELAGEAWDNLGMAASIESGALLPDWDDVVVAEVEE